MHSRTHAAFLIIALCACSCGDSGDSGETDPRVERAEESRTAWAQLLSESEGVECVAREYRSVFGSSWSTQVEFFDGVAQQWIDCTGEQFNFSEPAVEVCTRGRGVPPQPYPTMDELYEECIRDILTVDPAVNDIVFETDSRGIMTRCAYTPHGCLDDCTTGIYVAAVDATACEWDVDCSDCNPTTARDRLLGDAGADDCGHSQASDGFSEASLSCIEAAWLDDTAFFGSYEPQGVDSHLVYAALWSGEGPLLLLAYDSAPCGGWSCTDCIPSLQLTECPGWTVEDSRIVCSDASESRQLCDGRGTLLLEPVP